MAELTQRMIDAGATFIDENGIPTRADGTPALEENQGILAAITQQTNNQPWTALNSDNPSGYGFGPGYTPSSQDYPENKTPLAPATVNFGMPAEEGALNMTDSGWPSNWKDFKSSDTSTGGGFFTAADWFGGEDKIPHAFQQGSTLPSTNNWRLLPADFRSPQFIMRNGQIIDLGSTTMYGPQGEAYSMDWYGGGWRRGTDTPVAYAQSSVSPNITGWPGQLGSWGQSSTAAP